MNIYEVLKKTFLFSGLNSEEISSILTNKEMLTKHFLRGDTIYSCDDEQKKIGFVISGSCEVRKKKSTSGEALLNTLSVSDSFGILSVFSNDKFPTQIFASKNCEILFFTKQEIEEYVNSSSQIASNLVSFLINRINFLNEKIAILSSTRVEDRLIQYLIFEAKRNGCDSFYFNITKTSDAINAGRASLYRALQTLEDEEIISLCDKQIKILNKNILKGN